MSHNDRRRAAAARRPWFQRKQASRAKVGRKHRLRFEPLEDRLVLDAGPLMITEFMAVNENTLTDEDGQYSDWIEIHNPTSWTVDLAGWSLTDDSLDLTKWRFPGVTLPAGDYLKVFASDKNRTDAAGELHTNFQLGVVDYLALVQPNGSTISHDYGPAYPEQSADISYGIGSVTLESQTLVSSGDTVRYHVPTAGEDPLTWTAPGYNDSGWTDVIRRPTGELLITEVEAGDTEWVEIQNVTDQILQTSGWFIAVNDGTSGNINAVNPVTSPLPNSIPPGQVLYRTDNPADQYFGGAIDWDTEYGWAMIVDDGGFVVDFLPWGYDAAQIASLDISSGGFSNITVGDQFVGNASRMLANSWNTQNDGDDIGSPGQAGSHTYDAGNDSYVVRGGGADIWGSSDQFHFVHQTVSGDTEVIAHVTSVQNTNGWAKAGVMIRETMAANSKHGMVIVTPGQGVAFQRRTTTGGAGSHTAGPGVTAPYWVKLVRQGNTLTAYSSNDGANWSQIASETISMTAEVEVGIMVTAHDNAALCSAGFDNVSLGASISTTSLARQGDADHDSAADFVSLLTQTKGTENPDLTVPFPVPTVPTATGVGFSNDQPAFDNIILTDVGGEMRGVNGSLWTRLDFDLPVPPDFNELTLRMKYDDGFVAYLSSGVGMGTEVARRNAPATLAYNSTATTQHADAQAVVFEEIDISQYAGLLQAGTNVLAIHGLNVTAGNTDFLLLPELEATRVDRAERFFLPATPGEPNGAGFVDRVQDTQFSVRRGFFSQPFPVIIRADTPEATIRYTTDGSDPTETNGTVYTGPVTIDRTTTLRAAAFKTDYRPTNVDTQTYIFLDDVLQQSPTGAAPFGWPGGPINGQELDYGMDPAIVSDATWGPQLDDALTAIPTVSLVTDLDNLLDPSTGIYVNAAQDGTQWERAASVEWINPDGTEGFQIDARLQIRPGENTVGSNPKHALRLSFGDEHGQGKLEYPLFGSEGVDVFDGIDLRTAQTDSWSLDGSANNTMIRDVFARDSQASLDQPYTRSRYIHVYINGQYWGLYQTEERPEASYGESYLGGTRDQYDVVEVDQDAGYTIRAADGNLDAWQALWNQADAGFASDAAYYQAQGLNPDGTRNPAHPVLLDVDNLIDYMLVILYTGDRNAPISELLGNDDPNNWFALRDRGGEAGFQFFIHEAENTLSLGSPDRTGPFAAGDQFDKSNPQWLHQQLMANDEYRLRFADRAHADLLNDGPLTALAASARFQDRADEIQSAIVAESARWGDAQRATPRDKDDWLAAVNTELATFFPTRSFVLLGQLQNTQLSDGTPAPLYPAVAAPQFNQHGGQVASGFALTMTASGNTIYYTTDGSDPRLPGGGIAGSAQQYTGTPVVIDGSMVVNARAFSGGQWSARNEADFYVGQPATQDVVAISELNYNPHAPTPAELAVNPAWGNGDFEFIELRNTTDVPIDLTGIEFTSGIDFRFDNPAQLDVGEHLVVVRNIEAFAARYGTGIHVAGQFTGSLSNDGERIVLVDRFGQTIHDFSYGDTGAWPGRADGNGSSLEVISTTGNYSDDDNWRGSSRYGGSPGVVNPSPTPDVVVNEVLSRPAAPQTDAIELFNTTAGPIDVGGWYLSDSSGDYRKFQIPTGPQSIMPGGEYLVFDESDFNSTGGANPNDFALDGGDGDDVWLMETNAAGDLIRFADHVEFGDALTDVSFGRSPNGIGELVMMTEVTLGETNALPRVGGIVINEIHSNPDVKTEPVEYIELHNSGDVPMDISGWYFSAGITYTFPAGTVISAGGFAVVAENPAAAQGKFGGALPYGPYIGKLANDGERIVLRDTAGIKQDEVEYGHGFPWPTVGEEPGYSMELVHPSLDNNLGGSWRSSTGSQSTEQTLIYTNSQWRYFKGTQEPSAQGAWRERTFNDSSWATGDGAIGYSSEGDELNVIRTNLTDMRNGYSTVYLRKEFTVTDPSAFAGLLLQARYDDGINVWINGTRVAYANVSGAELAYNATANSAIDNVQLVDFALPNASSYLVAGTNVIAVHLVNASLGNSSDSFFDCLLRSSTGGVAGLTPGAPNSVLSTNAPPQMRQLRHTPQQPVSGEDVIVTVKATDPDGLGSVALNYQLVDPGNYIGISDSRYENPSYWATVSMFDDGTHGDQFAGDDVYTTTLPGALQTGRRLVRYRVTAEDTLGASVTAPYADDPQPNFAYYVYDGVPSWTGSDRPGTTQVTYSSELLESIPVYTLITERQDHLDAMYVPYRTGQADQQLPSGGSYGGSDYNWEGTMVYNGEVYDHIRYRARGGVWRYSMGKNMWKFDFNRAHQFQAHDDYGNPYETKWDKLNFSALIQQGNFGQRGEQGLFEWAGFKLHNLAGNEAPNANFLHFRLVEDADEGGPDQYSTDFRGLYMTIEQPDGRMLDEHGMPDGNFYKMEGGSGTLNNQGPTQPTDRSDLNSFMNTYSSSPSAAWWEQNFDLESYYSFRAIAMAIHDYDIHAGKNYFYYHNPETGKWSIHNWDLDLTWTTTYGGGGGGEPFRDRVIQAFPQFKIAYNNRVREIADLLFNSEQTGMLLDEAAGFIYTASAPGEGAQPSMAAADRAMWDYNPILTSGYINSSKAAHGRYYQAGGTNDFGGMVQLEKNYVASRTNQIDPTIASDDNQAPDKPAIAYIGQEGSPVDGLRFQASAFGGGSGTFAAMKWRIARVTDQNDPNFDPSQPRHYEITATWESDDLTTFDNTMTIPGDELEVGRTYRVRARMKDSAGRWSHWSDPVQLVAGQAVGPVVNDLRITEIMYNPADPSPEEIAAGFTNNDDFEFVELMNTGPMSLNTAGIQFTVGITFTFPDMVINPGQRILIATNQAAFETRYAGVTPIGQYDGRLNNGGEDLLLVDPYGRDILDFDYDDSSNWPGRADGKGSSLEVLNTAGSYGSASNWRSSSEYGGTPGYLGEGPRGDIVVNEVLSHTDPPELDAFELHNTTGATIDLAGWFLSDSSDEFKKFEIPAGVSIPGGGYLVFDANDFNTGSNDFLLDGAYGDDVWLLEANDQSKLTRFVEHVKFDAAANGESFGRWPDGQGALYPMKETTLGQENTGPRLGQVLISEVMYHPSDPDIGVLADDLEYVELYNNSGVTVDLTNWQLAEGVEYAFPTGLTLAAGATLVVVPFETFDAARLADFRNHYGIDSSVQIAGGYTGRLNNGGEAVRLLRPDQPPAEDPSFYPMLLEDEVIYDDVTPWPVEPDGYGASLHRVGTDLWGNDAANWTADTATPGAVLFAAGATVVGRYVFYDGSAFDNLAGIDALDDAAIAVDKTALLPNQKATFANYTSYTAGINGIMIDVAGLADPGSVTAADFAFQAGNNNLPNTWAPATSPAVVDVRLAPGETDVHRVTLAWSGNAVRNQWLEVSMLPTLATGLSRADVFYFGNAIGEAGDSTSHALINATDEIYARNNQHGPFDEAKVDDLYDYNRDGLVNASDQIIARMSQTSPFSALRLITPSTASPPPLDAASSANELDTVDVLALDALLLQVQQQSADRASSPESMAAEAVDRLLASYWP